ncbi:DUF2283 domain-containing protein [Candidatus Hakubella thermalkaliphila]|nr:DUF2283 domain-containing protein [Candidatus Hakubella thermalkaliphila]
MAKVKSIKSMEFKYRPDEDMLIISFAKNRPALAHEIRDGAWVRFDPETKELISLEFLYFSKQIQHHGADVPFTIPLESGSLKLALTQK